MKIISWNVNGIRAAHKKGFLDFFESTDADLFCIQETKALPEQLPNELKSISGYTSAWHSAIQKGYSGTAFWSKKTPENVELLGMKEFDGEGRLQIIHLEKNLVVLNGYFPNSQAEGARLDYKLAFNKALKDCADKWVDSGKTVVVTGDYNVAHKPIDLARPKENEKNPGYLPEERHWMDEFTESGWIDTFRMFEQGPNHYTWWSYRARARENNIGWRLDYFCINEARAKSVKASLIHPQITGSDHCPIELKIEL